MNILVVDHSPIWRQLVRCVFEPEHTVIEREDVTDGLQACGVHRPDWVLINIDMQGRSGLEAARQIKARWPSARLLAVAEDDSPGSRQAALALGATGCVRKDELLQLELERLGPHGQPVSPSAGPAAEVSVLPPLGSPPAHQRHEKARN